MNDFDGGVGVFLWGRLAGGSGLRH
jgi:hypothetical protein